MERELGEFMSFYDYKAKSIDGNLVSMGSYKGKLVLVVNTASKCGFTPQFEGLQDLYEKYQEQGFVVLGFPSNQFAQELSGSNSEINEFCSLNYGVSFPMFEKIEVNGENAHPLFDFLKSEQKGAFGGAIKWNFTKFLINKDGKVIKRFAPTTTPKDIEADIKKELAK